MPRVTSKLTNPNAMRMRYLCWGLFNYVLSNGKGNGGKQWWEAMVDLTSS